MKNQSKKIKDYILKHVAENPHAIVASATAKFKVTRTTIHRHLNKLIAEKKLIKNGTTNNITYYLPATFDREYIYKIKPFLSEFTVFKNDLETILKPLPENIYNIC